MNPPLRQIEHAAWVLGGLAAIGCVAAVHLVPVEATMGPAQKLFYLHVPAATCMLLACVGTFLGDLGYLWQRRSIWSVVALASAEVAVGLSAVVLISGMVWGRFAWGHWWTWSPRLTFSLVLALLYSAYLILYRGIASPRKRALFCAIYGVAAFVDVPLVYLSTKLLPDIHPAGVTVDPRMRATLMLCMITVMVLSLAATMLRVRHGLRRTQGEELPPEPEQTSVTQVR